MSTIWLAVKLYIGYVLGTLLLGTLVLIGIIGFYVGALLYDKVKGKLRK